MMNEDLHETLPLWSLDRRGDGPRGTATTRGVVGVSSPRLLGLDNTLRAKVPAAQSAHGTRKA